MNHIFLFICILIFLFNGYNFEYKNSLSLKIEVENKGKLQASSVQLTIISVFHNETKIPIPPIDLYWSYN